MSRNIEISIGEFYHLYNRGVEKRKIFLDENDHLRFLALLYLCNASDLFHLSDFLQQGLTFQELFDLPRKKSLVDISAYCLMPNHFHLLVREKGGSGASLFMQKLSTAYTMYFNKKNARQGSLFEGTFKAKHLDTDKYLKYQLAYIHLNPIAIIEHGWKEKYIADKDRAQEFLKVYPHSSYFDYLGKPRKQSVILNKKAYPLYFDSTSSFESMISEWVNFEEPKFKTRLNLPKLEWKV